VHPELSSVRVDIEPAGTQFRECGTQRLRVRHAPYRNVRRREKPCTPHRECGLEHLTEAGIRDSVAPI
jgi:hypothetical protein